MLKTALYLCLAGTYIFTFTNPIFAQWDIPDGLDEAPSSAYLYNENLGQVVDMDGFSHPEVKFVTDHSYPKIYLADTYVGFVLENVDEDTTTEDTVGLVKMTPINPSLFTTPLAYEAGEGISNYFLPQCPSGATGVVGFKRVVYNNIYPGIDMHFYSNAAGPKIYFVIAPGADPYNIVLLFDGQDQLNVTSQLLQISLAGMTMDLTSGYAYEFDSQNQVSALGWTADFVDLLDGKIGFSTGSYDPAQTLVLQFGSPLPQASSAVPRKNLGWCTYYGGQVKSWNEDVAIEQYGRNYFAGKTSATKFPRSTGAKFRFISGSYDLYILKFDSVTQRREFATFYGGSQAEGDVSIAINSLDEAHVAFRTLSKDVPLPTTQPTGAWVDNIPDGPNVGKWDLAIAKFSSNGQQLVYATYFGTGTNFDIFDIEINSKDEYYVLGRGPLGNFYFQKPGAYFSNVGQAFILKWNANHAIQWATPFKSSQYAEFSAMCFDANDNVFITGKSANGLELKDPGGNSYFDGGTPLFTINPTFMIKLDSADSLIWSTYLGSKLSSESMDIATDGDHVFVTGSVYTGSQLFPLKKPGTRAYFDTVAGNQLGFPNADAFITEFGNDGSLLWSTFLGGDEIDKGTGIDVDNDGNVYVSGNSNKCEQASGFPLLYNPAIFNQGVSNMGPLKGGYLAAFNFERLRTWTSYFGAAHEDEITKIRTYGNDYLYLGGRTVSGNTIFPLEDLSGTAWYDATKVTGVRGHTATYAARFGISEFSSFVSVREVKSDNWAINAYPNPTNSWLYIDLEGKANYQLMDISGRLLRSGKLTQETNGIEVTNLDVGSYLIHLEQDNKVALVKFIKE